MGTPKDIEEFVNLRISKLSKRVRGIIGDELGNIPPKSTILDAGCGIGNILCALYSNGYKNLYGFDIEEELINEAIFAEFPIMDKIPFSNIFKVFGRKIGRYMSAAWEFKVVKKGDVRDERL